MTIIIGSSEWTADLQQFKDAIKSITANNDAIQADINQITADMQSLASGWRGPAGGAFEQLQQPLANAGQQTVAVINEVIYRMNITLQNYENAESTNTNNLSN